jgi:hypothetical protein
MLNNVLPPVTKNYEMKITGWAVAWEVEAEPSHV